MGDPLVTHVKVIISPGQGDCPSNRVLYTIWEVIAGKKAVKQQNVHHIILSDIMCIP